MPFVLALLLALMPVTAAGEDSLCSRLPFLDTYRTMCLAPQPGFRRLLEDIRELSF